MAQLNDFMTRIDLSVLFWIFGCFGGKRTFTRAEGIVLTALYVAYTTWLVIQAV